MVYKVKFILFLVGINYKYIFRMYLYVILSNVLSGFLVIVYVKLFVEKYNIYKDLYIIEYKSV